MQQKGDFEQRPEVKPADQVPLPKAKASPALKVLCAVLAVIALGACGLLIYERVNPGEKTKCETAKSDEGKKATVDDSYKTIRTAKKIVADARSAVYAQFQDDGIVSYSSSDNSYGIAYEFEKGYMTTLDWSFGVVINILDGKYRNDLSYFSDGSAVSNRVAKALEKYNLKKKAAPSNSIFLSGVFANYESDDGYICSVTTDGMPFYMNCGHTSWLRDENKELTKKLVEAYKKSNKDYVDNGEAFYLSASVDDIHDAKNGYQTLQGSFDDAAALFYRKGTDGEWKFFLGTQSPIGCDQYNTDELKEAYEGFSCWSNDGRETTVKK